MSDNKPIRTTEYKSLINSISGVYTSGRVAAFRAANAQLVQTYWQIGQYIIVYEQKGNVKAEYGKALLANLSKDLSLLHGMGFSLSNVKRFRQFYVTYPKGATLSHHSVEAVLPDSIGAEAPHHLSWTHYVELMKIDDPLERGFYEKQSVIENWSTTELIRQKKASLFLRLAASKDKKGILQLAMRGQVIEKPTDILRDTYIFEFLKIPEPHHLTETDLEQRLITQLQEFLLELGKGFAFIGRQYRITLGNRHHYVDLVFYHRILKCFVLIDLKRNEAGYEDVGQMNMYLGYFENEENTAGDNQPIGIVLAKEKDELVVKYAMHNISSQLFVQKYQLYLPDKEELRKLITDELNKEL